MAKSSLSFRKSSHLFDSLSLILIVDDMLKKLMFGSKMFASLKYKIKTYVCYCFMSSIFYNPHCMWIPVILIKVKFR